MMDNRTMKLNEFMDRLNSEPGSIRLDEALETIGELYEFTPVGFSNGAMRNEAGDAVRSCMLYAFGKLQNLSESQTLACFGEHYREVLSDPHGTAHRTIRIFMRSGWAGVKFDSMPLKARAS
jgi:hypothetical protein